MREIAGKKAEGPPCCRKSCVYADDKRHSPTHGLTRHLSCCWDYERLQHHGDQALHVKVLPRVRSGEQRGRKSKDNLAEGRKVQSILALNEGAIPRQCDYVIVSYILSGVVRRLNQGLEGGSHGAVSALAYSPLCSNAYINGLGIDVTNPAQVCTSRLGYAEEHGVLGKAFHTFE
eukprot:1187972-Prorocentrum_minimum.AAC.1